MSSTLILIVILVYFTVLYLISRWTSKGADNDSFFLGNRKSPWYVVAFGMIGTTLSGVTFISVPGWVTTDKFYYMQMVFGYLLGYAVIANVLLPIYYKLNLTSIYTYLGNRFGRVSYKVGAIFFIISRMIGASFRLFLVAGVLQLAIFDDFNIPFYVTVFVTLLLIFFYTSKGGIKTIVWTDTLQTLFMLLSVIISVIFIAGQMGAGVLDLPNIISQSEFSTVFEFEDWRSNRFFVKQFLAGAFITIAMTGLDQDMMQKNLSCRNLKEAKKNMYWFSFLLVPVNLIFLSLGVLLILYAGMKGIQLPERSDDLFPILATGGYMPIFLAIIFMLGLIAAAYSSADSALTALTTSVVIDLFDGGKLPEEKLRRKRYFFHVLLALLLGVIILIFNTISDRAVVSSLFKAAGYTYGPLLGLFAFGIFTKYRINEKYVPLVVILAPVLSFILNKYSEVILWGYEIGFEILLINGFLTFMGLLMLIQKKVVTRHI